VALSWRTGSVQEIIASGRGNALGSAAWPGRPMRADVSSGFLAAPQLTEPARFLLPPAYHFQHNTWRPA
jgi:hypothetical protein